MPVDAGRYIFYRSRWVVAVVVDVLYCGVWFYFRLIGVLV